MTNVLRLLRDFVAAVISAEPRRSTDPESLDWMPRMIGGTDLASPYFLAMADRDAGWYQERRPVS